RVARIDGEIAPSAVRLLVGDDADQRQALDPFHCPFGKGVGKLDGDGREASGKEHSSRFARKRGPSMNRRNEGNPIPPENSIFFLKGRRAHQRGLISWVSPWVCPRAPPKSHPRHLRPWMPPRHWQRTREGPGTSATPFAERASSSRGHLPPGFAQPSA